ncbi:hypothetical protein FACS1894187_19370 [Synergistales bacterium]|nr:hypothetical protein FACS1894187_19370 [Synergistales bacterium]
MVFASYIPTVGNFKVTSQRPVPPGLIISPQTDTVCPTAEFFLGHVAERNKSKRLSAYGGLKDLREKEEDQYE